MASAALSSPANRFESVIRGQLLNAVDAGYETIFVPEEPSSEEVASEIVRVVMRDLIVPSYQATDEGEDFIRYWLGHAEVLRALLKAHGFVTRGQPKGDQRASLERRADNVFRFAGEGGETAFRAAQVELHAATLTVRKYEQLSDPDLAAKDLRLAGNYNRLRVGTIGALLSVSFHAIPSTLNDRQRMVMYSATLALAGATYDRALKGAELRGIAPAFPVEALKIGWPTPCGAMFKYLAGRAPDVLVEKVRDEALNLGLRARAVEAFDLVEDHELARSVLLPIARRAPLAMREAAICALETHRNGEVSALFQELADDATQPPAVRETAYEAISGS